jgi:hypothetical protein
MTAQVAATGTLLQTWAATGEVTPPAQAKIDQGWVQGERPSHGNWNWIENTVGQKVNHILKHGIALWDNATPYAIGDLVNLDGVVYKAQVANTGVSPVAGGSPQWTVYQKSIAAGSSAITVTEVANNNTSTIDVSGSGLVGKFDNTEQIVFSASGANLKATFNSRTATEVLETAPQVVLTAADANKTYYVAATGVSPTTKQFRLPAASSVSDTWKVWVNAVKLDTGALSFVPSGSDKISKDGYERNAEVRVQWAMGALYCIYKLEGSNVFVIAGDDKGNMQRFRISNIDIVLRPQDNGLTIFQNNTNPNSGNILLPVANTLPDNWSCKICIVNQTALSSILVSAGSGDKILRFGASVDKMQIYAGTKGSTLEVFRVPGVAEYVVTGTIEASHFEDYITSPIAITGGALYSRGYHITNNMLIQYGWCASNINTFPAGGRANQVDVPLLIPCNPSIRYGTYATVRDDSSALNSATYSSQPACYITDAGSATIRIGSYYNQSGIGINWMVVSEIPNFI